MLSNCCDAPEYLNETGLCSACKEHTEFYDEDAEVVEEGVSLPLKYRDWTISWNPKPIPIRTMDYDAVHDDYDPTPMYLYDPPSDDRAFNAGSVIECKQIIDDWEVDHG